MALRHVTLITVLSGVLLHVLVVDSLLGHSLQGLICSRLSHVRLTRQAFGTSRRRNDRDRLVLIVGSVYPVLVHLVERNNFTRLKLIYRDVGRH